jgi:hypothetical protein
MPVDEVSVLKISCDNPKCPGHPDLDPKDRKGWLFVSGEVYGEPTSSHVFGNADCLSQASGDADIAVQFGLARKTSEMTPEETT